MNLAPRTPKPTNKQRRSSNILIGLVLATGIIGSLLTGSYIAQSNRAALQQRATDIAFALSSNRTETLTGSTSDLDNPAYRDLKQRLINIRTSDQSVHSVYVLTTQDDEAIMLVNSDSEVSATYAPPGGSLGAASPMLRNLNVSRTPFTEGPVSDEHGNWITGYAPIMQPQSGTVVGIVAVEKSAQRFYATVLGFGALPFLLVLPGLFALVQDRRLRKKEEAMLQLRSKFVSVASHELRSPLSGMLWALESLLKPSVKNLTIEQQVILLDMYQSTEESLATINEILDMSALEKNKPQQTALEPIEIGNIIKNATKTLRLSANERGMKFAFVGNWNGDDCYTKGDRSALKRLFMNLITNAIKYGRDDTTISIRISQKDDMHIIAIEDHGIGIPATEQRKVLTGYYRASNAQKTQKPGTGLGLLLSKRVAEQHGGSLTISSKEGSGTTVYVALPVVKPS